MKEKMKINKENACILILIGILCLVVVWPTSKKDSKSSAETLLDNTGTRMEDETDMDTSLNLYIENQEVRLKNILSQIEGAGEVQVMIRASASKAYIVQTVVLSMKQTLREAHEKVMRSRELRHRFIRKIITGTMCHGLSRKWSRRLKGYSSLHKVGIRIRWQVK